MQQYTVRAGIIDFREQLNFNSVKYIIILSAALCCLAFSPPRRKAIYLCGKKYYQYETKGFLNDEMLPVTMVQIKDLKGKPMFGYYLTALRNDTNFISGNMVIKGDSILVRNEYRFHIKRDYDAITNVYLCKKGRIVFLRHYMWLDGKITDSVTFNKVL
jgi:hypothetical protein